MLKQQIIRAHQRICAWVRSTYLEYSPFLSAITGAEVYLKLENYQYTGSFKVRGAFNKLLSLCPDHRQPGIVAASSGNHGLATAYALKQLNLTGTIFVPHHAAPSKVDSIKRLGVNVIHHGHDCLETELYAKQYADENNLVFISPYNDLEIIAGQGTIGVEVLEQLPDVEAIYASVGGGGLISGIASYCKLANPKIQIFGCLPQNSPAMAESIKVGKIISVAQLPTLSDGTAGNIEKDAITFELCRKYADDFYLVSEQDIVSALKLILEKHHMLIEGAAAVAVAALLNNQTIVKGKKVVIVVCGANIGVDALKSIL